MKHCGKKDGALQFLVSIFLLLGSLAWYFVVTDSENGKPHDQEEIVFQDERDLRTGELFHVEIVRCRVCGEVISYVRFNLKGQPVAGRAKSGHHCNHILARVKYVGSSGLWKLHANIFAFVEQWQKRFIRSFALKNSPHPK